MVMAEEWATIQGGLKQLIFPQNDVSLCFCHFGHGATVRSHVSYNNPAVFVVIYPTLYRRVPSISATPLPDRGKPFFCEVSALFNHCQAVYA
jgi:hypothetical protein